MLSVRTWDFSQQVLLQSRLRTWIFYVQALSKSKQRLAIAMDQPLVFKLPPSPSPREGEPDPLQPRSLSSLSVSRLVFVSPSLRASLPPGLSPSLSASLPAIAIPLSRICSLSSSSFLLLSFLTRAGSILSDIAPSFLSSLRPRPISLCPRSSPSRSVRLSLDLSLLLPLFGPFSLPTTLPPPSLPISDDLP
ncbi:hypothetical protein ACLOJK_011615 [Asimina triloba]